MQAIGDRVILIRDKLGDSKKTVDELVNLMTQRTDLKATSIVHDLANQTDKKLRRNTAMT